MTKAFNKPHLTDQPATPTLRMLATVQGAVQGVGFRPFVYRLAIELDLAGTVRNSTAGVFIELEGPAERLEMFLQRLESEKPLHASIVSQQVVFYNPVGYAGFQVIESDPGGEKTATVLPDIATCPDCLREIFDPAGRRYGYPFTNCTNCGPRYSIVETLPYDRANTTMKIFPMCADCRREYENPADRRFHAQPNACSVCGPHLELWDNTGIVLATHDDALQKGATALREGKILALKGLGGFQLLADAANDAAVKTLRQRKAREEKPFALMYPHIALVERDCAVSSIERQALQSSEAPILLLRKKLPVSGHISDAVAPRNPYLGVMLPYTPLHHLLMTQLQIPVIATSGNLTDEPICIDEREAVERLGRIADLFLVHNRPIARQVDDSVARVIFDDIQIFRNARGYAPSPLAEPKTTKPTLAVGAHLKNSVAIAGPAFAFLSQHIGDLATARAYDGLQRTVQSLSQIYDFRPEQVACDLHPDYLSTRYAASLGLPLHPVQHHYAHVLSAMVDNNLTGPVLGVSWDGTGYGPDGTIWGGEFLRVDDTGYTRVAHFRTFRLPGGEKAVIEPCRTALGLLYEIFGYKTLAMPDLPPLQALDDRERSILQTMLQKNLNCPVTSSAGRLFDAVASLIGICHHIRYEGQAAMMLEFAVTPDTADHPYPFALENKNGILICDWEKTIIAILDDLKKAIPVGIIASRFHLTLAQMILAVAEKIDEKAIVLTGGCFQNRYLLEQTVVGLTKAGFQPYWHHRIPTNDGGIAVGQLAAMQRDEKRK